MFGLFGLGGGAVVLAENRAEHRSALEVVVHLASLQTSFKTLDEAIKVVSRRVNALEHVVIPSIEKTIGYIKNEMDEMEREEFYRVKKQVAKKRFQLEMEEVPAPVGE